MQKNAATTIKFSDYALNLLSCGQFRGRSFRDFFLDRFIGFTRCLWELREFKKLKNVFK